MPQCVASRYSKAASVAMNEVAPERCATAWMARVIRAGSANVTLSPRNEAAGGRVRSIGRLSDAGAPASVFSHQSS